MTVVFQSEVRKMLVSSDGGKTWDKTYLPRMNGERVGALMSHILP